MSETVPCTSCGGAVATGESVCPNGHTRPQGGHASHTPKPKPIPITWRKDRDYGVGRIAT